MSVQNLPSEDTGDDGENQARVDELAEAFAQRWRRGERLSVESFAAQHPEVADQLRVVLPPIALIEQVKRRSGSHAAGSLLRRAPTQLGDYTIVREIGRGGMGVVYEAEQRSLGRRVALKVLPEHALDDPTRLDRFRREAQAAARLHHTNIVPVFGLFESDGLHYYAMQFIVGRGLDAVLRALKRSGAGALSTAASAPSRQLDTAALPPTVAGATETPAVVATHSSQAPQPIAPNTGKVLVPPTLSEPLAKLLPADTNSRLSTGDRYWRQVATIGRQVAEALHYAHGQGTLHRDIKPANLLLDDQGTVWITDFGLAKLIEHDGLTNTGDVLGTLQYLAPECLSGRNDARSDVYALGITLYEFLTLTSPYGDSTPAQLLRQVTADDPTSPRRLNPSIPRDLETIVLKSIARETQHRYASARALADDLHAYLNDLPIQARRLSTPERLWRWGRRHRSLAAMASVAIVSLVVAATVGWRGYVTTAWALQRAEQQTTEAQAATHRAEANVEMSLRALEEIFAAVALPARMSPTGGGPPEHGPPGRPPDPEADRRRAGFETRDRLPMDEVAQQHQAAVLQTVLQFYEQFTEQNATNTRLQYEAAAAHRRIGQLHELRGNIPAARQSLNRAQTMFVDLWARFPDQHQYLLGLVETETYQAALEASTEPTTTAPITVAALRKHTEKLWHLGPEALVDRAAAEDAASQDRRDPDDHELTERWHVVLALAFDRLAMFAERGKAWSQAEDDLRRGLDLAHRALRLGPAKAEKMRDTVQAYDRLARCLLAAENRSAAKRVLEESLGFLGHHPPVRETEQLILEHRELLADLLTAEGDTARAQELRRLNEFRRPHRPGGPPQPPAKGREPPPTARPPRR